MHARVSAYERLLPRVGGPLVIVASLRFGVARALVAEELAECRQARTAVHEQIPIVVADLVSQVAEHGPIAFVQALPQRLAMGAVGLDDVQREAAFVVARVDRLLRRRVDLAGVDALVGEQPKAETALGAGPR